jgi:hypothetical protein
LEQQPASLWGKGHKAHLVQHQQVQLLELGQTFPQGPLLLSRQDVCNGRLMSHSNVRKLSHPGWLECRLTS